MTRALCLVLSMTLLAACHDRAPSDPIVLDGSSTGFPLAEALAHEFMKANKGTGVTVTFSGTGTGFVKFCRGQLDIANASRPITVEEQKACEAANVSFIELPVAQRCEHHHRQQCECVGVNDYRSRASSTVGRACRNEGHHLETGSCGLAGSSDQALRARH